MRQGYGVLWSAQSRKLDQWNGAAVANYGNDLYASFELKEMA
jgi:hypothetical protein